MPIARFQMPDGRIARFEVPEGTSPEQAQKMIADSLPKQQEESQLEPPTKGQDRTAIQSAGDFSAGLVRGAGSIGATILSPLDALGITGMTNDQRRAAIDAGLRELGASPESMAYKGGKLASEIAGTSGAGGLLAKGAYSVPALARFAPAIASGGFNLGQSATGSALANAGIRAAAGAGSGAATAGMINPSDVGSGALIGGALPGAVKAAGSIGSGLGSLAKTAASNALGATTGTGAEAISNAYRAGKSGATDFLENMRGKVPFDEVVDRAKEGLARMRADRAQAYRSGMVDIRKDKGVLDFSPISEAVQKVSSMGSFKGQQINKNAAGTVQELVETVGNWSRLPKEEFHTPEGLDALKQAIGDIRDFTQFGTAARRAADSVYNSVKDQITAQAPTYAKVMKDYSVASKTMSEIEKTLSLGDKASRDTAIRKLQSLTRNNVQTTYGNRLNLANVLEDQGGVSLIPSVAGQAMSSVMPRGLVGAAEKVGIPGAAIISGSPGLLAALPFTSPRIVGEALYGAGRLSGATQSALGGLGEAAAGKLGLLSPGMLESYQALLRAAPVAISANP